MLAFLRRSAVASIGPVATVWLLAACGQSDAPDDARSTPPEIVAVKTAAQALEGAHVPALDPATLNDAEIRKVIGHRPRCTFRYTSSGRPVVVAALAADGGPDLGVMKLNGSLVPLQPDRGATGLAPGGFVLAATPVRLTVQPEPGAPVPTQAGGKRVEAELVFQVGEALKVGYGGYLECQQTPPAAAANR